MTTEPKQNGGAFQTGEHEVVVTVIDVIDGALAGREGCTYVSPPQPREQALALMALLLGRSLAETDGTRWGCTVAGGRRIVELAAQAANDEQRTLATREHGS